jgi:VanZ family protein
LLSFLFPGLSAAEIEFWHGVTRKSAHVAEYFILGALTYRCLKVDQPNLTAAKVVTILFLLAAACIDEFHQLLTITRGASLTDVGYDGLGGVSALWLAAAMESRRTRNRSPYESRHLHPHSVL